MASVAELCRSIGAAITNKNEAEIKTILSTTYPHQKPVGVSPLVYVAAFKRYAEFNVASVCAHLLRNNCVIPRMVKGEWWKSMAITDGVQCTIMMLYLVACKALTLDEALIHAAKNGCPLLFTILSDPFHANLATLRKLWMDWVCYDGDAVKYLLSCRVKGIDGGALLPFQPVLTNLLTAVVKSGAVTHDQMLELCAQRDAHMTLVAVRVRPDVLSPETRIYMLFKNTILQRFVGSALAALVGFQNKAKKSPLATVIEGMNTEVNVGYAIAEGAEAELVHTALSTRDVDLLSGIMCCGVGETRQLSDGRTVSLQRTTPIPSHVWIGLFGHDLFVKDMRIRLCTDLVATGVRMPRCTELPEWWRDLRPGQLFPTAVVRYLVACRVMTPEDAVRYAVANGNIGAFIILTDRVHAHPDVLWPLMHIHVGNENRAEVIKCLRQLHAAARPALPDTESYQPVLDRLMRAAYDEAVSCGKDHVRRLFNFMVMRRDFFAHYVSSGYTRVLDEAGAVLHVFRNPGQQHQVGSALMSMHRVTPDIARKYVASVAITRGRSLNAINLNA